MQETKLPIFLFEEAILLCEELSTKIDGTSKIPTVNSKGWRDLRVLECIFLRHVTRAVLGSHMCEVFRIYESIHY